MTKQGKIKKTVWISYDLGLKGDYEGLYRWLDSKDAKECVSSLAVLNILYRQDLLADLVRDLKKNIKLTRDDRIYVIYRDDKSKTMKGKFVFGNRKVAPWKGFAAEYGEDEVDF